jgi:hypothetical protein
VPDARRDGPDARENHTAEEDGMPVTPELDKGYSLRAAGLGNVVRVSVPAEVYFNLDKIQKVQKDIFNRLGHPHCYSGWDIRLDLERNFMVDERLNVKPMLAMEEIG